jgi:hypothetical protein
VSASDRFWQTDPLPVAHEPAPGRCDQCWCPSYASVPGHELCREHFMAHQQSVIAAMTKRIAVTASLWVPVAMAWSWGLWEVL